MLKQGRVFNRALLRSSLLAEIVTLPYLRAEIDVHFICQSSVRRLSKVDSRSSISSATFQREMKRLSDSLIKTKTKNKKSERRRLSSPSLFPHHAASSAKMLTQPDVGGRESQNYNILTLRVHVVIQKMSFIHMLCLNIQITFFSIKEIFN